MLQNWGSWRNKKPVTTRVYRLVKNGKFQHIGAALLAQKNPVGVSLPCRILHI